MKKALIIYQSKTGTTRKMGKEISDFLTQKGIQADVQSVESWNKEQPVDYDYLFLGCWTKGLMIFNQHPEKEWSQAVSSLQLPEKTSVALFATYKIAIGSMFKRMRKSLNGRGTGQEPELKSKDGSLNAANTSLIAQMLN